eukprot:CAMPEP_0197628450 /NCGR_PEP_ID=MMETSP1338-20131121/6761_1 /TAXON_ID=43686 ORGANISM="Pelagodinium beii, Strain RCC1491" /NCGR_SAMPLE_ID=MMETSP1338 /ASSEMBLY_ACC=CAM_ASM_000754 /LENGTH=197 /DNA_ID=CAMNT_0043199431 /DNA_START=51 /DNA_END=644 /DNA_ORIENTATION=+
MTWALLLAQPATASRVAGHHSLEHEDAHSRSAHQVDFSQNSSVMAGSKGEQKHSLMQMQLSAKELFQMLAGGGDGCDKRDGEIMGCSTAADRAGCTCGLFDQCYKKLVTQGDGPKVDIGVCGLAMPWLVVTSAFLFIFLIASVVAARMYLSKDLPEASPLDNGVSISRQSLTSTAPPDGPKRAEQVAKDGDERSESF